MQDNMKSSPRISVHVGTHFQKETKEKRNTADLFADYSEKILASGYRAYLRGDKMEGRRFEHFVDKSKQARQQSPRPHRQPHQGSPARLRRLEGRCVWALTLRENLSRFVLTMCRMDKNLRRRG